MPNKQLTAKVRLNTSQAEKSIDNLVKKINKLNAVTNKAANATKQNQQYAKTQRQVNAITNRVNAWAIAQKSVVANTKATNSTLSMIGGKLRRIASTYLGIMGTKAVMNTTDTLVGAQNKLNYVNANSLGESGYNADGTYSAQTFQLTQEALDKMYASSQKVRTSYTEMMNNVSKTMMLSGDAFNNNIDNAIRFQEIMAEAYAVGGASAQEQHNSMYQLTQALGSGILQGDELRSVREGAPLAYQAIEKFAQGVYNTTDSLKDLASEGKITSEMVVASVMNMGSSIDTAFAQTKVTFAQTFDQIKNSAMYAFQPVMEMLTEALQEASNNGLVQKFEVFFTNLSKGVMIVLKTIETGVNWIADNWYWLRYVFYTTLAAMVAYLAISTATACAIFLINNPFVIWIFAIGALVTALAWMRGQCENTCEFIIQLAMIVAKAIVGVLMVVLAVYLVTGAIMLSVPTLIALAVIAAILIVLALFIKFAGQIIGAFFGIEEVALAICSWIDTAWSNMCNNMSAWFWNAIADMLDGCDWLLKGINKIREALGKEAITVGDVRARANASKANVVENKLDISSAWSTGYNKGYGIGTVIQDKINSFSLGGKKNGNLLDNLGSKLGLDFSGMTTPFPSTGAGNGYEPDYEKMLGGIGDDTGKIADSMDLTQDDLEYLRRIADMEWKKEYTTASITLDVTNNNTVSSELDVFGIADKLAEVLYEEAGYMANGVY